MVVRGYGKPLEHTMGKADTLQESNRRGPAPGKKMVMSTVGILETLRTDLLMRNSKQGSGGDQ